MLCYNSTHNLTGHVTHPRPVTSVQQLIISLTVQL